MKNRDFKEKSPNKRTKLSVSSNQETENERPSFSNDNSQSNTIDSEKFMNFVKISSPRSPQDSSSTQKNVMESGKAEKSKDIQNYEDEDSSERLEEEIPEWAKSENARDKNLIKNGEPGYDPTTLYI